MKSPDLIDETGERPHSALQPRSFVTTKRLQLAAVALISVLCALALPYMPTLYALVLVMIFPVIIIGIYILKNPYTGVFIYYLYEFLRPYDFIMALRPLRLSFLIEVVTLISWLLWMIRKRPALKWDKFNWLYVAFLVSMAIGVFLALNNFRAYTVFQLILINFVIFVVATNAIDSVKRLEKVIWLLILTHIYFALVGIYNFVLSPGMSGGLETSGMVGSSFMADENDFAMALNVMIPILFFMSVYYTQRWKKVFCLAIAALFVMAIVASFSRGGLVGLVVAVSFCVWFSGRRTTYFGLALAAGLVFASLSPAKYLGEMETIGNTSESTADARLRFWKAAGRILLDHPIIGVGAANGGLYMPDYIEGERNPHTQWGRSFHGLYPQIAADLGGVGLTIYTLMLAYVLSFLNRIRKRMVENTEQLKISCLALALLGSIVTFVLTSTFLSTAYYPQLWTFYAFAITLLWLQRDIDRRQQDQSGAVSGDTLQTVPIAPDKRYASDD